MTGDSWLTRNAARPDGRLIVWFGAGLSKDSGMPLGYGLTDHWLRHHLPDGETDTILRLFADNEDLLDKDLPRLEKVIEDAIWTFGTACLENLEFFRHCNPNALHRAIADHMAAHRLYAVTTNFDTAVEDSRPGEIPVITPATGVTADWGLIKLHGSMGEDPATLCQSIANLQAGVQPELRDLILRLLDDPDNTIVFCGYSGADFFDIVPLFQDRARAERPFAARAAWLHHVAGAAGCTDADRGWSDEDWEEALTPGALSMLQGFDAARKEGRAGDTRPLLAELIPVADMRPAAPHRPWWEGWEERFAPDAEGKALYAAKLYASLGMGTRSASFLALEDLPKTRFDRRHQLMFNALRDQGFYRADLTLRHWATTVPSAEYSQDFHRRQMAVALPLLQIDRHQIGLDHAALRSNGRQTPHPGILRCRGKEGTHTISSLPPGLRRSLHPTPSAGSPSRARTAQGARPRCRVHIAVSSSHQRSSIASDVCRSKISQAKALESTNYSLKDHNSIKYILLTRQ